MRATKSFFVDPAVYPLLVKWGLSTGYKIETNESHNILYRIVCLDGIRIRELKEGEEETTLTKEEAETLVNDLLPYIGNEKELYEPGYDPPIRIHDDFYVEKFLPAIQGDHEVRWEQWGIYYRIHKVLSRGDGELMDRNDVVELIRQLEYKSVMSPFVVAYNILKNEGTTAIMWAKRDIKDFSAARRLMEKEKGRHVPRNWRIYQDVTATAIKEDSLPDQYVSCEGWLWLRAYHSMADYWEQGFYGDLEKLKNDLSKIQDFDIYAHCAIYACVYHEPGPEPEPEAEPEGVSLKAEVKSDIAALDKILTTKGETASDSFYFGDQWVRGCRSGMAIALDILTGLVKGIEISERLTERPIRIRYIEGVQERHVLDKAIISEPEEDHGTSETK